MADATNGRTIKFDEFARVGDARTNKISVEKIGTCVSFHLDFGDELTAAVFLDDIDQRVANGEAIYLRLNGRE